MAGAVGIGRTECQHEPLVVRGAVAEVLGDKQSNRVASTSSAPDLVAAWQVGKGSRVTDADKDTRGSGGRRAGP